LNFTSPGPVALQASKATPWAPKKEKEKKRNNPR